MNLQKDLREFIELLNSKRVEYVIVGAHALAFHGHPRYTGDLDVFVRVSPENAQKIVDTIASFGFTDLEISEHDFLVDDNVIQLGVPPNRIDLLMSLTGISFEEVWKNRVRTEFGNVPVPVISRNHLIVNKRAVGRPQDLADIARLTEK
ncbi:MAG: hypothetical protein IID08_05575 [Candidatus Hydrogenedentes bacterium]|nr:hypothetical protein [Candidatus Hydrogenedentota bacterium]